jgi:pantoate--beta-alanine ligase
VAVVTQMGHDLKVDLQIRVVPTVRDPDGLALSSRNARLSAEERARALAIPRALGAGLAAAHAGRDPVEAAQALLGGLEVDYVAVADFNGHPTLAIAARAGRTRLIDNVRLDDPQTHLPKPAATEEPPHGQ